MYLRNTVFVFQLLHNYYPNDVLRHIIKEQNKGIYKWVDLIMRNDQQRYKFVSK